MRRSWPLVLAVAAFYVAAVVWIAGDRTASQHVYDSYSTMSTAGEGLSLAYAYLQRQQRNVSMMTHPLGTMPIAANGVVFRVGATPPIMLEEAEEKIANSKKIATPLLRPEEYDFIAHGGRIVLAVPGNLIPLEFRYDAAPTADSVFPFAANVRQIAIAPRRGIDARSLLPRMVALYAAGPRVVVARESIGRGDLVVVADPEIFTNDQLRIGHHLPFLLALCGEATRPLLFDETIHGLSDSDGPLALLQDWNLGPFLALLLGVAALIVWRGSSRVGAPEDSYRETRSDAVDLVHSLGALYEHSMTEIEALRFYHDALVRQVAAQTGLRGDALHRRVGDLTGRTRSLAAINKAFEKLKETGARHAKHS
jgi:hypothetical protein